MDVLLNGLLRYQTFIRKCDTINYKLNTNIN